MSNATPSTPKILSWAAVARPHLSQHTAAVRLRTNIACLAAYAWIWLMPTYYRYLKAFITFFLLVLPVIGKREKIDYGFQLAEHLVLLVLVWNVVEACLALRYPTVAPQALRPRPTARTPAISPVALTTAQRRLKGTPKSPLPETFSPSPNNTPERFPALSFSPTRSSSFLDSPSRLTSPSSLSRSYLGSSLGGSTSTLSSTYMGVSRGPSIAGRPLDQSDVDLILADLK